MTELIDTLRLHRNTKGYHEMTHVSIYTTWVRQTQLLVVYPHHNEQESWESAQRHGFYFVTNHDFNQFMRAFIKSWTNDEEVEVDALDGYDREWIVTALYNDEVDIDDEYIYRVVVRELSDHPIKGMECDLNAWGSTRFGVAFPSGEPDVPVLIGLGNHKRQPLMVPHSTAIIMAKGFTTLHYDTDWSRTICKAFRLPVVVIERTLKTNVINGVVAEENWKLHDQRAFTGIGFVVRYTGDYTETYVEKRA